MDFTKAFSKMVNLLRFVFLVMFTTVCNNLYAQEENKKTILPSGALNGERYRVFISTDIGGGGDDDYQSLAHYFVYDDLFDTEGIISLPPKTGM